MNTHSIQAVQVSALKPALRLASAAVAIFLTACGGGGGGGGGPAGVTVGGNIAGLLSAGMVLSDGTTTVSPAAGATTFTFANAFMSGASFTVSIQTQPAGLTCTVNNASGQVGTSAVTNVAVVCPTPWLWEGGATTGNSAGVYGSLGTAAASNGPGARDGGMTWSDASGDLWLFGGYGYDSAATAGYLNDLWRYSTAAREWTWVSGAKTVSAAGTYGTLGAAAPANTPGARQGAATWRDAVGNLWLFGGYQTQTGTVAGLFNDLWMFSPTTGEWTWVGGTATVNGAGSYGNLGVAAAGNLPPARAGAVSWRDAAGDFWLFGGSEYLAASASFFALNDLWKFSPASNQWTWEGGANTPSANGSYGVVGVAATTNMPGARESAMAWTDASGNFWLFGGNGFGATGTTVAVLNDLWKFAPSSGANGEWTWVAGANTTAAKGVYGSLGAAAAANVPGARNGASTWVDAAGNLWLFAGSGIDALGNGGALNDVWMFSPVTVEWTWVTGFSVQGASGTYGTIGAAGANAPGGRAGAMAWVDSNGKTWIFGGIGLDSISTTPADLNDLWNY